MVHKKNNWIQKSIKHRGSLRNWAKKHKFIKNGKIDLDRASEYAHKHHLTRRIRQINLARTLRKIRS
jgi:hypothetical protein